MDYVTATERRAVAVHCHAGLGRTGLAIACFFAYSPLIGYSARRCVEVRDGSTHVFSLCHSLCLTPSTSVTVCFQTLVSEGGASILSSVSFRDSIYLFRCFTSSVLMSLSASSTTENRLCSSGSIYRLCL